MLVYPFFSCLLHYAFFFCWELVFDVWFRLPYLERLVGVLPLLFPFLDPDYSEIFFQSPILSVA